MALAAGPAANTVNDPVARAAAPEQTSTGVTNAGGRQRADRRPDIRRLLADAGPLSRAEVEERLGQRGGAIAKWLRRMLQDGEVATTRASTRDPYTKYQLTDVGRAALPR